MSELYVYTTPLHEAIRAKNIEQVEMLLKNNADIFKKDDEDITPLELAQILNNNSINALLEEIKGATQSHTHMTLI
jgi:ankyrin repeat protein